MPRGNGSGPAGMGPMTGRAAGFCAGFSVPGFINRLGGRGGFGGGFDRGLRHGFRGAFGFNPWATPNAVPFNSQQELELLQNQAGNLESTLGEIRQRIQALEQASEEKK